MSYQILSLKWRPTEFNQVIGQSHITQALSNAIKLNRLAHAFTFSGPRGVGKTTTARLVARALNCLNGIEKICKENLCQNSRCNTRKIDIHCVVFCV